MRTKTQNEAEKRAQQLREQTAGLSLKETPLSEAGLKDKGGILVWTTKRVAKTDIDWETIVEQEREARSDSFNCLEICRWYESDKWDSL